MLKVGGAVHVAVICLWLVVLANSADVSAADDGAVHSLLSSTPGNSAIEVLCI
jgi:hypothetical protein